MDPLLLKVLHLAGVFALFSSLGATMLGGSKQKSASILHGVSLLLIFLLGFAMLGKPPSGQFWWIAKVGLWLFIGVAPVLSKKKLMPSWIVLTLCILAATAAGYLGIYKPF
ncbi:MAG: hypothetical protein NWT08_01910 [Akkermansiaceae bacterium]|jgi:hypothetical protein|nr:hypothetical protein [Akkermansiaceae bacterium]MDP4721889.1 hypothetical protein [Akkermansiaceae bacterium]MDP4847803.1 hypothetical protein [Akkermansiaceae bacterium]MDP4897411.1 hypothetical protein [Akkermansiaceae bacterium]MDP4997036.1 hypothetical protein [Akkermansiaceae bacterium]